MSTATKLAAILAVASLAACVVDDELPVASGEQAVEVPNGPFINGPFINGPFINGPFINGPFINGPFINGVTTSGGAIGGQASDTLTLGGSPITSIEVVGTELKGVDANGNVLQGPDFIGAVMTAEVSFVEESQGDDPVDDPELPDDLEIGEMPIAEDAFVLDAPTKFDTGDALLIDKTTFTPEVDLGAAATLAMRVTLRIEDATYVNGILQHYVTYEGVDQNGNTVWLPVCGLNDDGTQKYATPKALSVDYHYGQVGDGAITKADPGKFLFACDGSVIHKCEHVMGYTWIQNGKISEAAQACGQAVAGRFCGNGVSFTVNGQIINLYDNLGINVDNRDWELEAKWNKDGAVQVNLDPDLTTVTNKGGMPLEYMVEDARGMKLGDYQEAGNCTATLYEPVVTGKVKPAVAELAVTTTAAVPLVAGDPPSCSDEPCIYTEQDTGDQGF